MMMLLLRRRRRSGRRRAQANARLGPGAADGAGRHGPPQVQVPAAARVRQLRGQLLLLHPAKTHTASKGRRRYRERTDEGAKAVA